MKNKGIILLTTILLTMVPLTSSAETVAAPKAEVYSTQMVEDVSEVVSSKEISTEVKKGSELEKAILAVKEKFEIGDNYDFTYDMNSYKGKTSWNLNWKAKNQDDANIYVGVDAKGRIISYSSEKYTPYDGQKSLPKISEKDAVKLAKEFILKVNPDIADEIQYRDNNSESSLYNRNYYINFIRIVNGIPFYNNNLTVNVDKDTGNIQYFNMYWTDDVDFTDSKNAINLETVKEKYKENMGLSLIYNKYYKDKNYSIESIFRPKYDNNAFAIDALTGEMIKIQGYYYPKMMYSTAKMERGGNTFYDVNISPEEQKAIDENSNLLTQEQAELKAREIKIIGLTDEYTLNYSYLNTYSYNGSKYSWSLEFANEKEVGKETSSISVGIDAITGEINSFYIYTPYEKKEVKSDRDAARVEVEKFLKEFIGDKFEETVYDDTDDISYTKIRSDESSRDQSFRYDRKVNGITYPSNGINVGYDFMDQKIISYSIQWNEEEFPSIDNVISYDEAVNKLFEKVGMELKYVLFYSVDEETGIQSQDPQVKLVYALKSDKNYYDIDANTGVLLDHSGKEYKEQNTSGYTDIEGHYAQKAIEALAEYGIKLEGEKFNPDQYINQLDFLTLISQISPNYYGPIITMKSSADEIKSFYTTLGDSGIIKESEKAPDTEFTREEAVKYFIRALKYDEVASIKGIYKTEFSDENEINPELIGYVAIAQGLNVIQGSSGSFRPKDKITRAEAAMIVYNYLSR